MEFLEVPLFDDDLYKLAVRFLFNVVFVALVVGVCYYRHQQNRAYIFTFVLMNVMVFFICFTLKKLDLGLGMALGLFAIFAIIRYRTDAIRVKEMTYLFIVIGVAVINALSNKKTSYAELLFTNGVIVSVAFLFEQMAHSVNSMKLAKQEIVYDNLELLGPSRHQELLADVQKRTGIAGVRVKLSKIDLNKGTANITVFYDKQS